MTLIYLNTELDVTKEHELFNITENGFKVTIKYLPTSWRYEKGRKEEIFENCTEIHNLFDSISKEKEIAFESDIQATGFTRKIEEIESVEITLQPNKVEIPTDLFIDLAITLDKLTNKFNCNDKQLDEYGLDWSYFHKLARRSKFIVEKLGVKI